MSQGTQAQESMVCGASIGLVKFFFVACAEMTLLE